ncbi:MAG TPA: Hsp20/alpha crystallin family protein [Anaerolineaceae bacterium]|jgi:HSP20 family protein
MTFYVSPLARINRRAAAYWPDMLQNDVNFPVDVKAENDDYVITALLPGIKAEELDIQVVNDTISIQGEFKVERGEKDEYLLIERPSGRFSRELSFPATLDASKAEAQVDNGVLTLRVSKTESARPKTIKVVIK